MPRIPDASDLDRAAPVSRRGVVQDRSGEILASAFVAIEEGHRAAEQEKQVRRDRLQQAQVRAEFNMADAAERAKLDNDPDWATYEDRFQSGMDKVSGSLAEKIRDPDERALFETEAKVGIANSRLAVRKAARARETTVGVASLDEAQTRHRELALTTDDPDLRMRLVQSTTDAIAAARDNGYISPEEAVSRSERWTSDFGDGYLDTLSAADQVRELTSVPANSPVRYVPADRRALRLKGAQRELDQERREREAEQRARISEAKAAMSDHLRDMQVAAQLGMPVDVPQRATMIALYGDQEGAQRYRTAERLATLSGDVAKLQDLPSNELVEKVGSYAPTQVDGAAEQVQLQQAIAGSASRIIELRAKDPAGYLTQHSPLVRRAWDEMSRDPAKVPEYLSAVRAEKERLGIPGTDVLPQGYVTSVADEIAGTTAEKMADRIEEEAARWGPAWPQVYGQLAGKLPDTAAVIGSGIPKSAATTLAATANLKPAELKAMLPANVKPADVENAIAGQFEEFVRSMPAEAARTVTATLDAANRLTTKYMGDGMSRGAAAQRAHQDLVGSQYELRPLRGATIRIPVGVSADTVEAGAQQALAKFEVDSTMVDVPQSAALSAEEYAERMKGAVRARGYWLTNPGSTGLRLFLDGQPVFRGGAPVEMPWDELSAAAATAPHQFDVPYAMRGYME